MFQHTAIAFRHMQPFHAKTGLARACGKKKGQTGIKDRGN